MKAIRIHRFGAVDVLLCEDVPRPVPADDEVLVRVLAAGVGPWDAWVRQGRSAIQQTLPLIPGADVAGIVERVGAKASSFTAGDAVFGATNARFTGGYAEYATASAGMVALRPPQVSFNEAGAVPVVGCTAWQMVFDHGRIDASKRVLIHGGAGNVGALAVQLVRSRARDVIVTALSNEVAMVRALGVERVVDVSTTRFEDVVRDVDVVLDTVGGDTQTRSFTVMRPGGVLVSSAAPPDTDLAAKHGVTAIFFLVAVTTDTLTKIGALMAVGDLVVRVGEVVALADARKAHDMLAGAPHRIGKIVLTTGAPWPL
jgi:NADPH:quinone reductase-like Zn-dependent oxidoreductase